jgi:hypothetical protein
MTKEKKSGGGGGLLSKVPLGVLGGLGINPLGNTVGQALGIPRPGVDTEEEERMRRWQGRPPGMKKGGKVKKKKSYAKGGSVRGDGIARQGKTKGRMC